MTDIAVIGIDCRFPGAPDKDAFWKLLMDGVVTDNEVPPQRWDVDAYYHPDGKAGSANTRRAHFIDDPDVFDNDHFGIAPIEAAALDPQQRLLLQSAWRALEDGGIDPRSLAGSSTGVFVGMMSSEWTSLQMLDYAKVTAFRGAGAGYFMAANRISYHLNLTGPSMAIDTACSSSLMAVHQGCVALRSGDTDTVIAAGANLILTPALSIFYTQAGLSAPDGRCKPFGQGADGIGRGEGVGSVVLRRLDDAIADGQPVYAVVRSSVANHDGRSNGITAPNRRSQVELMRRALALAEVDAQQIDFVEAHGTGTFLGDMIEANALGDVHKTREGEPCLLGSVKGNIGHTEGSAGIAAFIKACMALHHRVLPPTVFGDSANAGLRLEAHGLRLADGPHPLPTKRAMAGVSSFGLGGSNAHVVLESAPALAQPDSGTTGILTLSAPSGESLRRNAASMASSLARTDDDQVAGWCRTSNVVKRSQRHRFVHHGDRAALIEGLQAFAAGDRTELASSTSMSKLPAGVGILCSGQGAQYQGMTRPLYDSNLDYRDQLDAAVAALQPHLAGDLREVMFGGSHDLHHTSFSQPALFAVSYALGNMLLQSGVSPVFGIGHSVGEFAIACLAGVLSLEEAAWIVAARGRLMGSLPPGGSMVAIDLSIDHAEALVAGSDECSIAAVNGPRAVVVSGSVDAVGRVYDTVRAQGGKAVNLRVSHAFHSPLMRPIVDEFRRELSGLTPNRAHFPVFSTVLGREIKGDEMDADYWAAQICSPVKFFEAVGAARATGADYVAEAGPRSSLLAMARQCGLPLKVRSLTLCEGTDSDGMELLAIGATLLRDGFSPDVSPLYGRSAGTLHRVPSYVFATSSRFWFDGGVATATRTAEPAPVVPMAVEVAAVVQSPGATTEGNASEAAVLAVIADVGGYSVTGLARSSRLSDDLGYDSLLQLRLFERLRDEYPPLQSVPIVEVLPKIRTVGEVVDFVVERIG